MLATQDLIEKLKLKGIPKFRAIQIMHAVCKEGKNDYELITTLPQTLKDTLKAEVPIFSLKVVRVMKSLDGCTQKGLFELNDGLKVEAVLMKFKDGRHTVCISSQAGCQLGCRFCATGTMKFGRNLTYEEIADQVLYFAQLLHPEGAHRHARASAKPASNRGRRLHHGATLVSLPLGKRSTRLPRGLGALLR